MSVTMRSAVARDELKLKQLFLNCFDDTLGFVNMFFEHHFVPENAIVAEKDGKIIGLTFLLPCSAEGKLCYYIYGVCVDPAERGMGVGKELLRFAIDKAKERGALVLLKPENKELFAFYEKVGFSPCSYYREEVIAPGEKAAEFFDISEEEYLELRNKGLEGKNAVIWDKESIEYALSHEIFFGGRVYRYRTENEEGIVLFIRDGIKTVIKETTASREALPAIVAAGIKVFGGEDATVLFPSDEGGIPYACGIGFKNLVYLNLMLD